MKIGRNLTVLALTGALALTAPAALAGSRGSDGAQTASKGAQRDIVDVAAAAGNFETLVAAVKAAGLVDALKGDGPFTVFAPTDEAFAKLPAGTVENLLKPENKDTLVSILTYHVVPGAIYAADARPGRVETLQGSRFAITARGDALMVDDAKIVATDIEASNGVIHVIDSVIMPEMLRSSN